MPFSTLQRKEISDNTNILSTATPSFFFMLVMILNFLFILWPFEASRKIETSAKILSRHFLSWGRKRKRPIKKPVKMSLSLLLWKRKRKNLAGSAWQLCQDKESYLRYLCLSKDLILLRICIYRFYSMGFPQMALHWTLTVSRWLVHTHIQFMRPGRCTWYLLVFYPHNK